MSVRVSSLVWDNGPTKAADRLMMLALADNSDDNGLAWPGMTRLAAKCCVGENAARATIRRLEGEGWLRVEVGGGSGRSNRYHLNMERLRETPSSTGVFQPVETPLSAEQNPPVDESKTPPWTGGEPSVEPPVEPSLADPPVIQTFAAMTDEPPALALVVDAPTPPKRACQLPASWVPNDGHLGFVRANGLDGPMELAQFRDHHTAKGSKFKDWDAAFRTWLRNAVKYSTPVRPSAAAVAEQDDANAWMRRRPAL